MVTMQLNVCICICHYTFLIMKGAGVSKTSKRIRIYNKVIDTVLPDHLFKQNVFIATNSHEVFVSVKRSNRTFFSLLSMVEI